MPKKDEKITEKIKGTGMTVTKFLLICVMLKILTIDEAITALRTNRLPDDILERIRKAELKGMN
jgi:hypothetical protein